MPSCALTGVVHVQSDTCGHLQELGFSSRNVMWLVLGVTAGFRSRHLRRGVGWSMRYAGAYRVRSPIKRRMLDARLTSPIFTRARAKPMVRIVRPKSPF